MEKTIVQLMDYFIEQEKPGKTLEQATAEGERKALVFFHEYVVNHPKCTEEDFRNHLKKELGLVCK